MSGYDNLYWYSLLIQVAPRGIADRVILGLIPSSERGWPTACSCLRPDKGGWLHVHGNVDTRMQLQQREKLDLSDEAGGPLEGTRQEMLGRSYNHYDPSSKASFITSSMSVEDTTPTLSVKQAAWCVWAKKVAEKVAALLQENQPLEAKLQWNVCLRHVEHVKSYAPHVDHLVVDLECRHDFC